MNRRIDDGILERHEGNAALMTSYFGNSGVQQLLRSHIIDTLYSMLHAS